MNDIAVLIDSGTDVPQEYVEKYGMYMLPLTITYENGTYHDRVDIEAQQVIDRLQEEIPKTSLPSMGDAEDLFRSMEEKGIRQVICVTISSGLSGTNHMLSVAAQEFPQMDIRVVDTKNIGIGAGITAIRGAELIQEGKNLDEVMQELERLIPKTKVFFCVETLEYLQKGGRIGLVTAKVGTLLGIRPIISCNEEGVYYTVQKARGAKAAAAGVLDQVQKLAKGHRRLRIVVAHAGAEEKAKAMAEKLRETFDGEIIFAPVSPALVVHTGPGLLGVGLQVED